MALHVKSTKSFKILLGFSAILISGMAATFSITGIATLFSGYFLTVAMMMGALEFAKIVVASFLARYWSTVSKILRSYFIAALITLILITSGGIFGYLSDAYQRTKGDYTIVEKQTSILESKKNTFIERKTRLQSDRDLELKAKNSNQTRADSLSSRNRSITQTRADIKANDTRIAEIEKQITAAEDSVAKYDLQIIDLQSQNIQGELGPLKYIAGIFNTDMDTVVKYFIFLLIFVFDPLAVLLFVSLNTLIRKDELEEELDEAPKVKKKEIETQPQIVSDVVGTKVEPVVEVAELPIVNAPVEQPKTEKKMAQEIEPKKKVESDGSEDFVKELIEELEKAKEIPKNEESEHQTDEHEFYHEEIKEEEHKKDNIIRKSSNYHPN